MKVNGVYCPICQTFVFSRAHYDCRRCPCGNIFVDGGQDKDSYIRYGAKNDVKVFGSLSVSSREITQSLKELYNDWNKGIDNYGYIKEEKKMNKPVDREKKMEEAIRAYEAWDILLNYMEEYFDKDSEEYNTVLTIMDKIEEKNK